MTECDNSRGCFLLNIEKAKKSILRSNGVERKKSLFSHAQKKIKAVNPKYIPSGFFFVQELLSLKIGVCALIFEARVILPNPQKIQVTGQIYTIGNLWEKPFLVRSHTEAVPESILGKEFFIYRGLDISESGIFFTQYCRGEGTEYKKGKILPPFDK